jgi:hypothetical protein
MKLVVAILTGVLVLAAIAVPAAEAHGPAMFKVVGMSYSSKTEFTGYQVTVSRPEEGRVTLFRDGSGRNGESTISCAHPKGRARRLCRSVAPPGPFPLTRSQAPCDRLFGTGCIPLQWGNLPLKRAGEEHYLERQNDGSYAPKQCGGRSTEQRHFAFDLRVERKAVRVGFSLPILDASCGIASWGFRKAPRSDLMIPLRRFLVKPGKTIRISDRFKTALLPPRDPTNQSQAKISGTYRSSRLLVLRRVDGLRHSRR